MEMRVWQGRHTHAGVEVLTYRICLPRWEGLSSLDALYEQIGASAEDFCRRELIPLSEQAYEDDPDPKKRFRFRPYRYTLTGSIEREDGERIAIALCARLIASDGVRQEFFDEQIVEKASGMLLKPKRAKKERSHRADG